MEYAKFAMQASLTQTSDKKILKIRSNNPLVSKYTRDLSISSIDIRQIEKFLFFSDSIIENTTIYADKIYANFIEKDFLHSFTKKEFKEYFFAKVNKQEDDITLIFINKLHM